MQKSQPRITAEIAPLDLIIHKYEQERERELYERDRIQPRIQPEEGWAYPSERDRRQPQRDYQYWENY